MNLSKNFTLEELTISQEAARNGLRNEPNSEQTQSLVALCEKVLQPLRDKLRVPVVVNSGFRSATINRRIGGSFASQHTKGQAADIIVPGKTVGEVIAIIRKIALPVDQCIDEFGQWVHVSYGPRHRREFLIARRVKGQTEYRRAAP